MDSLWYKDTVMYELPVQAFCDSDADGNGDFPGLIQKLDYLRDLGVSAILLLPFYPSPPQGDGYEMAHYKLVDSRYGMLRDFETLLREAQTRGMHVLIEHRLFHYDPNVNVDQAYVRRAQLRVIRYWLDMGVDGLRLGDVADGVESEGSRCEKDLRTAHDALREIRQVIDQHYPGRVLVANENRCPEDVIAYFGDGDECHLAFNVALTPRVFMAVKQENRRAVVDTLRQTPEIPAVCQWAVFLRNRDELKLETCNGAERDYLYQAYARDPQTRLNGGIRRRLAPLLENDRRRLELAYALLFSLPGIPVIYYGDEIGMGDNVSLAGREALRTPMQWSGARNAGFSGADPARLYAPAVADPIFGYQALNVEAQEQQRFSLLNWMRRLIAVRKQSKTLAQAKIEFLEQRNEKVLAYIRRSGNERILVVANLSGSAQSVQFLLGLYAGIRPVEMLGGTAFPRIGSWPYSLALAPYGFYWFRLDRPSPEERRRDSEVVVLERWAASVEVPGLPA